MKIHINATLASLALISAVGILAACQSRTIPLEPVSQFSPVALPSARVEYVSPEPEWASTFLGLDLKEANVLDVAFTALGEGKYRFDVTLVHDDQGESPSFADRWVVEDLAGKVLGERILLHAHGNEPFTRSETIYIPESVSVILIRGHDAQHGFGGQAIQLDLRDGSKTVMVDRNGD